MQPLVATTAAELRAITKNASIALTPTMGALHEGHLSLIKQAKKLADINVVSIYVNPLQFGENEDFDSYPRDLSADCDKLRDLADVVFAPQDLYVTPQTVRLALPPLADELCGHFRPGFFQGVATVVCKLFNSISPQTAVFGLKDFQQTHIIRLLTAQLNFNIDIVAAPIVRETDGLAMSSRNIYLHPAERAQAILLPQTLQMAAKQIMEGVPPAQAAAAAAASLTQNNFVVDYVEARDYSTLGAPIGERIILLAAVKLGKTRLIDNIECVLPTAAKTAPNF
ncbi:MAG: pantoate--beta-alanine ligase [Gammaproteobacteria bacterium WSBS_2016_MAG_OTU1]